jgi:hypothetical protein
VCVCAGGRRLAGENKMEGKPELSVAPDLIQAMPHDWPGL